jgi:hypothetical protein
VGIFCIGLLQSRPFLDSGVVVAGCATAFEASIAVAAAVAACAARSTFGPRAINCARRGNVLWGLKVVVMYHQNFRLEGCVKGLQRNSMVEPKCQATRINTVRHNASNGADRNAKQLDAKKHTHQNYPTLTSASDSSRCSPASENTRLPFPSTDRTSCLSHKISGRRVRSTSFKLLVPNHPLK